MKKIINIFLIILLLFLGFGCKKEDLSKNYIQIKLIHPKNSENINLKDDIIIETNYNINPDELDMMGFYTLHIVWSKYNPRGFAIYGKLLDKRNEGYSHIFSPLQIGYEVSFAGEKEFYYQVKLIRKISESSTETLALSDYIRFKMNQ